MAVPQERARLRAFGCGCIYGALLFAIGFVLGTLRVLIVAPLIGTLAATMIELPLMLLAGYLLCIRVIRRGRISTDPAARAMMTAGFIIVLAAGELWVGMSLFGRSFDQLLADWRTTAGALGFAAQAVAALFPFIAARD